MRTNYLLFIKLCLLMIFSVSSVQAQDLCKPVGWGKDVTGGGNATPVVVSSYSALKDAVSDDDVRVVHIKGTITFPSDGRINIQDQSNKTIFGLPGSKLVSVDMSSDGSGIFYVKRMDNLILQNVYFEGPGAYDNDGNDNLTVDDSRNVWVDHCEFHDGMDGNFDIKNKADLVSVTWCTFSYEKPPRSGGSGGSPDHRYTNLIGSSDGATGDRGKLRVTFQYCRWGEGCKERMPRVRYGKVHVANCYFSSSVANQGIRAGYEADIRAEGNYFISGYNKPIDLYKDDYTAVYANNNQNASNINKGSAFNPPYSITIADPSTIIAPITSCAGQTLASFGGCSSCSGGGQKDCNGVTNGSAYLDDCSICVGGNTGKSPCTVDCNGDVNGTAYLDNCNVCVAGNTGFDPCSETIQGEDACYIDGLQLEAENANFEGEGYANTDNLNDVAISWKFTASSNATITVSVRYANGGATARSGIIYVNDVATGSTVELPITGAWDTWEISTFTIAVQAGKNDLKFVANSADGLANLDALYFSEGISNTGCIVTNIFDTENTMGIQAFPNPFTEAIHLDVENGVQYKIINSHGAILEEGTCTENCSLGALLRPGIYILETQNNKNVKRVKVLKN